MADGWLPVGMPFEQIRETFNQLKIMAKDADRNPADLKIVLLAFVSITQGPQGTGRWSFSGDLQQIKEDVQTARDTGVEELILGPTFAADSQTEEGYVKAVEQLSKLK